MSKRSFRDLFAEAERDPAYWTERAVLRATEEICLAMEREKISRAELARRLGTSPAYVTKVLRGKANFTLATLARIAYALEGEFKFQLSPRDHRTRQPETAAPAVASPGEFPTGASPRSRGHGTVPPPTAAGDM